MSNNNDYTTGNLLGFGSCKENYKLIAIDLSKQTKLKKLLEDDGATIFFIIRKSEETAFNVSQNSATIL